MCKRDPRETAEIVRAIAEQHGPDLRRYLQKRLRPGENVDDMEQEVYLRLVQLQTPQGIRVPLAYLRYLGGQVLGEWRQRLSESPLSFDPDHVDAGEAASVDAQISLAELDLSMSDLERLLPRLNGQQRTAFLLRHWYGFSVPETAARMNLSTFQVRHHLVQGKRKLKEILRQGDVRP
jgi:RNA polymerase sigma factor (sigma-70 family)